VNRLKELIPAGANIYVEIEPRADGDTREPPGATLLIPPPDAGPDEPFPYEKARMLGALLVQEGLARVDEAALYRYRDELLMLQDDARRHQRGIWASR
jgi:hypothetical protein